MRVGQIVTNIDQHDLHSGATIEPNGQCMMCAKIERTTHEMTPATLKRPRVWQRKESAPVRDHSIPIPTEDTTAYHFRFLAQVDLIPALQYTPVWRDAPWAPVRLATSKNGLWTWEIVRCPYCAGTHSHGGDRGGEPRAHLGGRIAHCHPNKDAVKTTWDFAEYRLVGIEGEITRDGLDRYFPIYWEIGFQIEPRLSLNSPELRDAVWSKSDGHCWYCGVRLRPFSTFAVDHVVALNNGGSNALSNLVPSCHTCNSRKRDYPLELFRIRNFPARRFWFESGEEEVAI